ncbi:MAG: imidazole glycerol phosphate synthase cyclase subunit [Sphingobacteriales bacterium]|jgi:cyclase|nr:imidazole glycerol phosphate synthase cyclase subunit [Sphingobacteriales bacterium]
MNNVRVIPRLDIKGPNLVKGIHLEGLRVLGKPEDFARYYYEYGADELFFQDVVASLYERNSLHDIISRTARNMFIPLTVGGGLRTIDDIKQVLRAGADKVSLNTAAIRNPQLVRDAAQKFGSSTIVVAIEAIKQPDGRYLAFVDNGREETGVEVVTWAKKAEELGAGEILITSVDREGTAEGFDLNLIKKVADVVHIPVIAHGGAGSLQNIAEAITIGNASALAIASIFHYASMGKVLADSDHEEGNTTFLRSGKRFGIINPSDITQVKEYLKISHIPCRPI